MPVCFFSYCYEYPKKFDSFESEYNCFFEKNENGNTVNFKKICKNFIIAKQQGNN